MTKLKFAGVFTFIIYHLSFTIKLMRQMEGCGDKHHLYVCVQAEYTVNIVCIQPNELHDAIVQKADVK